MLRSLRAAALPIVVLIAVLSASCGSDDGSSTASTVTVAPTTTSARTQPAAPTARVRIFLQRGPVGIDCERVVPVARTVSSPAVLRGAMAALLRGPTAAERRRGYGGWFSPRTAGRLRSASLSGGVARIDFRDFSRVIPNASSACGSALLLAQLTRTATQFPGVRRAVYSFDGSVVDFYAWLQLSPPS